MQTVSFVAVASVATSIFWTPDDPFVGKWSLDVSRSTIVDEMRVEALGPNRYRFSFEGAPDETIVADGTDQPGVAGTTLSVKPENANSLMVVRKQDGHIIVSASWKLSQDRNTLYDAFTSLQPDGSKTTVNYVYKRMSAGSGFAGAWESTTKPIGLKAELAIRPYENKGLSFVRPDSAQSVTFDGRDHAISDKLAMTLSGRRRETRIIEYTEKTRGKIEKARQFEVSPDGRTLTETLRTAGQSTPDILVFERE